MPDFQFLKKVIKYIFLIFLSMILCNVTRGVFIGVLALFGAFFAMQKKSSLVMFCFLVPIFLTIANRAFVGTNTLLVVCARIGMLLMVTTLMLATANTTSKQRLPIGLITIYIICAVISSISGYVPIISFLKIFNFVAMLIGITLVIRIAQQTDKDLQDLRAIFYAFAVLIIPGSLLLHFFPDYGYSNEIMRQEQWDIYITGEDISTGYVSLYFNGMVNHSQALGPIVSVFAIWLLCDMLFVERKINLLTILILLLALPILYLTRSRTAYVTFCVPLFFMYIYCIPKARMPRKLRATAMWTFTILGIIFALTLLYLEASDQLVSKLLRKSDDVHGDKRSLFEAFTASRMELIGRDLNDFKKNPLFGMGFQVTEQHQIRYRLGQQSLFSAPIEKGNLLVMILGEGGVFGLASFLVFIVGFYGICSQKRYMASSALMTTMLISNIGEAAFFSPSGHGGFVWIVCAVGGFCIDMINERKYWKAKAQALPPQ